MVKVLFVCLGNICRSPTAQGVFEHLLKQEGLESKVQVDSAGTSGWHAGEAPDPRAQEEARRRGIEISHQRSRQVRPQDFDDYDYVVTMDGENLDELMRVCPKHHRAKLRAFTAFAPALGVPEVPDPYYGGAKGFSRVYEIIEASARGLLDEIRNNGHLH